jgi:hypothetical protein
LFDTAAGLEMQFNFTGIVKNVVAPEKIDTIFEFTDLRLNKSDVFDAMNGWGLASI